MMTDKEIIEALQSCTNGCIKKCPYDEMSLDYEKCMSDLMGDALALLNRQNATIEKYRKEFDELNVIEEQERKETLENAKRESALFMNMVEYVRADAIKEFVERLIENKYYTGNLTGYGTYAVMVDTINKIAEKMTGENYE